uniref:Wdpcp protein n=1 Tax=Fopius arisanus TaxID=64838 RepID=A0A0C9QXN8_9HYME
MHVSLIIRCCLAFPKVERKFSLKEIIKVEMFSWSPRSSLVIVFIPVVIGFFVDFSGANDQCKNKMMNIVMKVCSGAGVKSRRDIEDHWAVPHSSEMNFLFDFFNGILYTYDGILELYFF